MVNHKVGIAVKLDAHLLQLLVKKRLPNLNLQAISELLQKVTTIDGTVARDLPSAPARQWRHETRILTKVHCPVHQPINGAVLDRPAHHSVPGGISTYDGLKPRSR